VTTTGPRQLAVSRQGHYSGAVTRLAAFAIDQAAITGIFTVVVALTAYAVDLVTGGRLKSPVSGLILGVAYGVWWFVYFAYPWAVSGKTLGMSLLGIRVVRRDGSELAPRGACLRALSLPLGFVTFGIGFAGIVFGREHRAFHDLIARSAVVYDWDARTAQLRFLAGPSRRATPPRSPAD